MYRQILNATFCFAAAPEWAETINNTQIDIGSEHTMRCVAAGKPFPLIRWYKDGYMVRSHQVSLWTYFLFLLTCTAVYIWVVCVFSSTGKGS